MTVLPENSTPYDVYRLTHIFKLLGTRIIPTYFFTENPKEFVKWQFNACRQTALISAYFFRKLMQSYPSDDIWVRVNDGEFQDKFTSWYNHAWMTASRLTSTTIAFIDVARVSTYPIVEFQTPYYDPSSNSAGLHSCDTRCIKVTTLDYFEMLKQSEYYTGKPGIEVCKDIEKMMHVYNYRLEQYEWGKSGAK